MEHNPVIALFLALAIIIAVSRLAGAITRQFGQPRVLGELIVGVLLGPTLLNFLHLSVFHGADLEETIRELAELGVVFLMFIVGLGVHIDRLLSTRRVALVAGAAGTFVPVMMAVPIVLLFGYGWEPALFAGVALAATSVSISAQVLLELGVLRTKEGNALLATALVDDVLAILLVSFAIAVTTADGGAVNVASLGLILVRMVAFIAIAGALAWFVLPRMMNWIADQPQLAQAHGIAAAGLVFGLLFAWGAEEFGGVAAITGAFIAGVGISQAKDRVRNEVSKTISGIAYAFLVPIFFVNVGLVTDLRSFPLSALPFALVLLISAVASKVLGCGIGAKLAGFNSVESMRVGVCMISRGEVGLIIATLALSSGVFAADEPVFATLFLVILLTTVLTPILVRRVFAEDNADDTPEAPEVRGGQVKAMANGQSVPSS